MAAITAAAAAAGTAGAPGVQLWRSAAVNVAQLAHDRLAACMAAEAQVRAQKPSCYMLPPLPASTQPAAHSLQKVARLDKELRVAQNPVRRMKAVHDFLGKDFKRKSIHRVMKSIHRVTEIN